MGIVSPGTGEASGTGDGSGDGVASGGAAGVGSSASEKSSACVCWPAAPSTLRPWSRWNASTAAIVPPY